MILQHMITVNPRQFLVRKMSVNSPWTSLNCFRFIYSTRIGWPSTSEDKKTIVDEFITAAMQKYKYPWTVSGPPIQIFDCGNELCNGAILNLKFGTEGGRYLETWMPGSEGQTCLNHHYAGLPADALTKKQLLMLLSTTYSNSYIYICIFIYVYMYIYICMYVFSSPSFITYQKMKFLSFIM
ncbi:uncharacterized protein LOC120000281 isoform X2 [Tripterygium wilfordii]|uniref:uncharacterized protein LOC120000281 isoform X2 n=1 Tax=Tripterygium wilfordii TaxID=458696 RepID=UPI0018F8222D|nr:uncharacterized protein LOC120000281 isoform X2 [Tripterygium wilfordii]